MSLETTARTKAFTHIAGDLGITLSKDLANIFLELFDLFTEGKVCLQILLQGRFS